MHEKEIWGIVITLVFLVLAVIIIKTAWISAGVPIWLALLISVLFGGTAVWACTKVCIWWYHKLKDYFSRKK